MTGTLSGYNFYLLPSQPTLLGLTAISNSNFALRYPTVHYGHTLFGCLKGKLTSPAELSAIELFVQTSGALKRVLDISIEVT